MNIKITGRDMLWGYLGYFFTIFTNLMLIPFVMHFVESKELGLWYTFLSVGQLVNLLDFGFSNTLVRNVTYAYSGAKEIRKTGYSAEIGDDKGINYRLMASVLKTCEKICLLIAGIALLSMGTGGTVYICNAAKELEDRKFLIAWVIYTLAIFYNIYYSYWISSLRGIGAIVQAQKANVFSKGLQILISLVGLIGGGGIIALSLAYLLSGLFIRGYAKYQFKHYGDLWTKTELFFNEIKREEIYDNFRKIWVNAKKAGIVSLGTFCTTQATTLLCSSYLGLEVTASYGLSLQIITALTNVAAVYFQTMVPLMTEQKILNRRDDLIKSLSSGVALFWILYLIGISAFLIIGLPLIRILKSDTVLPLAMVAFPGFYLFLEMNHSLFATYISLSNTIPYMMPSAISGAIIIIGEIIGLKIFHFNIYGLMAVQCIVQLAYNNWKWPREVFKELHISPITILKIAGKQVRNKCSR